VPQELSPLRRGPRAHAFLQGENITSRSGGFEVQEGRNIWLTLILRRMCG
jgi:hypothetical protein